MSRGARIANRWFDPVKLERIYRRVYLLVTFKWGEMIRERRQDEFDRTFKDARAPEALIQKYRSDSVRAGL